MISNLISFLLMFYLKAGVFFCFLMLFEKPFKIVNLLRERHLMVLDAH